MIPLLIYGSGGHAREVLELVRCINDERAHFEVMGWIDDDPAKCVAGLKGLPVLARDDALARLPAVGQIVIALGSPTARRRVAAILADTGITSPALVHPRAWVGRDVELGPGTQVAAGATISTDVRIGRHAIVNQGVAVAHDVVLGDYATLAPGVRLSGAVTLGEGADVGTGAAVIQGVHIGAWSVVGAGAAVVRDVPDNATVIGVPSRVIAERPAGWHETV